MGVCARCGVCERYTREVVHERAREDEGHLADHLTRASAHTRAAGGLEEAVEHLGRRAGEGEKVSEGKGEDERRMTKGDVCGDVGRCVGR